jgi:hypothetical protein
MAETHDCNNHRLYDRIAGIVRMCATQRIEGSVGNGTSSPCSILSSDVALDSPDREGSERGNKVVVPEETDLAADDRQGTSPRV